MHSVDMGPPGDRSEPRLNTICPVCGTPTSPMIPPVALEPRYAHHHERQPPQQAVSFCSFACLAIAQSDPDRFLSAALENRIASHERRTRAT